MFYFIIQVIAISGVLFGAKIKDRELKKAGIGKCRLYLNLNFTTWHVWLLAAEPVM